jgi:hypothetical protein
MTDKKLTTQEACVYLAGESEPLKPNTLEIWRLNGKGPRFIKIGKLVRYAQSDLDAWLDSKTCTSTSQYATHLRPAAHA